MSVLVAYASKHGSTEEIARFITDRLRERGIEADAAPVQEVSDLSGVEAVVLGSAVYLGSWMKEAPEFVDRHLSTLRSIPVWLFSVGPSEPRSRTRRSSRSSSASSARSFGRGTTDCSSASSTDKLGFGERMMVKAVKAPEGDFRNWDEIGAWADDIATELA